MVDRVPGLSIVTVYEGLNEKESDGLVDVLHLAIVFLAETRLDHPQKGFIKMLTHIKVYKFFIFFLGDLDTDLKEVGFESLEPPVVGSCLFDQRDAEVQLIKIVQNLIDPRDDFASMFLESVVNMFMGLVSDEVGIHEGKHVYNLVVGLKDARKFIWLH